MLPEPRDHREGRVVAAVFTLLREACRWPTFEVLDRFLDGQGELDAEGLLAGMPLGLVHGAGPNSRPIRDDQEIGLTVAGLASVDAASEDVGLFLDLVRLAADLESAGLSGAPVPILTAEIAEQRLQLPAAGRADLLARAGAVLATESWGWSSHDVGTRDGSWSFSIDRRVRPFRGLRSLVDYWRLAHPQPWTPGGVPPQPAPVPTRAVGDDRAWLGLLHPDIAAVVVPRLEVGHADNAVEETWKVVAAKLRGLSGLDLDGVDLVNQALGSKGPLQLSDRMSAQGRNDHDGITNLLRGLAQAGRNVRAHRPSNTEAAETEIAALLLVASLCLDRLHQIGDDDADP